MPHPARPKKLSLRTEGRHAGTRLDHALAEWLPEALGAPLSKSRVRALIVAGAVYLNGRRVRIASKTLIPGAKVDVYVDPSKLDRLETSRDQVFVMKPEHILFEDDWLIAVNKPAGLPTQPTLDEARDNLYAALKRYLTTRPPASDAPGPPPYVGLHHRLDRDTSGVVLFTKRTEANAGTAALFSQHLARKTYEAICLVSGEEPPAEWMIRDYLARDPAAGKRSRFCSVRSGGDPAETGFRLLARGESSRAESSAPALFAHVEARPKTGRTHQIRVHLSEAGMPICGDRTYGSPEGLAPRVMLHAVSLIFPHPVLKMEITVSSPRPGDFTSCLKKFHLLPPEGRQSPNLGKGRSVL